jgi:hypothetical protein
LNKFFEDMPVSTPSLEASATDDMDSSCDLGSTGGTGSASAASTTNIDKVAGAAMTTDRVAGAGKDVTAAGDFALDKATAAAMAALTAQGGSLMRVPSIKASVKMSQDNPEGVGRSCAADKAPSAAEVGQVADDGVDVMQQVMGAVCAAAAATFAEGSGAKDVRFASVEDADMQGCGAQEAVNGKTTEGGDAEGGGIKSPVPTPAVVHSTPDVKTELSGDNAQAASATPQTVPRQRRNAGLLNADDQDDEFNGSDTSTKCGAKRRRGVGAEDKVDEESTPAKIAKGGVLDENQHGGGTEGRRMSERKRKPSAKAGGAGADDWTRSETTAKTLIAAA